MIEENHVINKPIFAIVLNWLQTLLSFKLDRQSEQFYSNHLEIRLIFQDFPLRIFSYFQRT